jgi:ankyrin repeat protein
VHYAAWGGHGRLVQRFIASRPGALRQLDGTGNSPFLYAVFGGHLSLAQALAQQHTSCLGDSNRRGHTALIQAACAGHLELVEWLVAAGLRIDRSDDAGNTALLFAAWGGHLGVVQWLLAHGARSDETSASGHTVLLSAANSGQLAVVQWAIEHLAAPLDQRNSNGDTPVLLAAFGGHLPLLQFLLARGGSPTDRNDDGLDAILSACNGGHRHIVSCMVQRDFYSFFIPQVFSYAQVDFLHAQGQSLHVTNEAGYTPAILAACGGHLPLLQHLVEVHRCTLFHRTVDGDSALLLACFCGHLATVQWLLDGGRASLHERNNAGLTPLLSAANGGHVRVVEYLLAHGASLDERDRDGYTPLLLAALRDRVELFVHLVARGASLDARTVSGQFWAGVAPLGGAVASWVPELAEPLPALHVAARIRSCDRLQQLLEAGHSPHARDAVGRSVLEAALQPVAANGVPRMCPVVVALVRAACGPVVPATIRLFGPKMCVMARLVLLVHLRLEQEGTLPLLPLEVWVHILGFLDRDAAHALSLPAPRARRRGRLLASLGSCMRDVMSC